MKVKIGNDIRSRRRTARMDSLTAAPSNRPWQPTSSVQPKPALTPKVELITHPQPVTIPKPDTTQSKASKTPAWLSYAGLAIAAVALGLLSLDVTLGQWIVGLVGIIMLVFKLDSRIHFGLALATLVLVPIFLTIHRTALADNYAVYCYYWLVFGTIAAIRELKIHKK